MSDLLWHPILPWPWLALLLALALAGAAWTLWNGVRSKRRTGVLGILRLLMFAALVAMLLQPQQRRDEVTILRPQLAVLVDTSESMNDVVDAKQPVRAQRVAEWFKSRAVEQAKSDFDLRVFSFDRALAEQPPETGKLKFAGSSSNVLDAVNQVQERFRGQPLASVLLLSDGLDTGGAGRTQAVSATVPVNTFELEKPFAKKQHAKRISLAAVDFPPRIVVGWDAEIRVTLAGAGMGGQTVPVELWRDGRKQTATQVAFNEDDQTRQAAFPIAHNKTGPVQYEIRVNDPAADKEAHGYQFLVEVLEQGNRVIYVQNTLGFDFKFLRKAIASDRNLQLNAFVRWADGRLASLDGGGGKNSAADFSPETIGNCPVLILGDLAPEALSPAHCKAIRDFVDHGGGLVLLGGPNLFTSGGLASTPLAALLPVGLPAPYHEGSFPVRITDTGLHHPVFGPLFAAVGDFPPLLTCNTPPSISPNAEVLMQAVTKNGPQPLVVSMRFGQGRVVAVLTDTMWRWRLASGGWTSERSPHDTFWTQLMDWLIPKEQEKENSSRIELFTERSNYTLGERPEIRAVVHSSAPDAKPPATLPVHLRTPDDRVFDYTLKPAKLQTRGGSQVDGYSVAVEPNVPGVFRAKSSAKLGGMDAEGETRFLVSRPATEITGKPIDRELLKRVAESTGGKFYTMENWNAWPGDLHFKEQHFSRVKLVDLWNHPVLLGLLMGLLVAEWITRKLWNLP